MLWEEILCCKNDICRGKETFISRKRDNVSRKQNIMSWEQDTVSWTRDFYVMGTRYLCNDRDKTWLILNELANLKFK